MQSCPNCHTENLEGVIFCQHCGVALVPVPISTRQINRQGDRVGTGTLPADNVVMLHIEGEEIPQTIQLHNVMVLGRFGEPSPDSATTYFDLTPYHAEEKGVSRRHAQLTRNTAKQTLTLSDLNSTNGSRLNGEAVPPMVELPVRDGDEIVLGRLKLYIYFRY